MSLAHMTDQIDQIEYGAVYRMQFVVTADVSAKIKYHY